jgi:hypothetical protein
LDNPLNNSVQSLFDWCLPWITKNNLIALTILCSIAITIFLYFSVYRKGQRDYFGSMATGIIALTLALITSYAILFTPIDTTAYKYLIFISPTVLFLINVFIRMLILFWIFGIIYGFFKPGQVEVGVKIFGVELSHKYSQEDVQKARIGHDKLKNQLSIIDDLTKEMIEYLSTPFEERMLGLESRYDIIRDEVKAILNKVYLNCLNTQIQVLPLTNEVLVALLEPIGAIVRKMDRESNREDTSDVIEDIYGIGLHYGTDNLSTLIIIDVSNTDEYQLSRSEINCVCTLFTSISSIIAWAEYDNNPQEN